MDRAPRRRPLHRLPFPAFLAFSLYQDGFGFWFFDPLIYPQS